MKYIRIENGLISENAILSIVANSITKVGGIFDRRGEMIDEFIYSVSGHDLNKGIKLVSGDTNIEQLSIYVDVEQGTNVESVIENLISQVKEDLKIFVDLDPSLINIHVLEVK